MGRRRKPNKNKHQSFLLTLPAPEHRSHIGLVLAIVGVCLVLIGIGVWSYFSYKEPVANLGNAYRKILTAHELEHDYARRQVPEDIGRRSSNTITRPFTLPILMYHHVGILPEHADAIRQDLTVSPQDFEKQVAWLAHNGYSSVTLEQFLQSQEAGPPLPKKAVVLTFDDGYKDVFDLAVPILKKYNFIGSFAIITRYVGNPDYATWEQISLAQSLGMEIVSHTQNHFDGKDPKYSSQFITDNLAGSLADLSLHGIVTRVLIYPYGHYTPLYIKQAMEAGFAMGLTVHFGKVLDLANLMEVPRLRVHGKQDFIAFTKYFTN